MLKKTVTIFTLLLATYPLTVQADCPLKVNAQNEWLLTSYADLKQIGIGDCVPSGAYRLSNDIDASTSAKDNCDNLGTCQGYPFVDNFSGTLHGDGHVISGLYINQGYQNIVGFIGNASTGALIDNLGLEDVNINGGRYTGAVLGQNSGAQVRNVFATGKVYAYSQGGGIIGGILFGSLSNSYSSVNVNGGEQLGGLVGTNMGTIDSCYAVGKLPGTYSTYGNLIGKNTGKLNASFALNDNVLVGTSQGATLDAYSKTLSSTNMMQAENFKVSATATWDFNQIWILYPGNTYPLLRAFMQPLALLPKAISIEYDGTPFSGGVLATIPEKVDENHLFGSSAASYTGTSQGAVNVGLYLTKLTASGIYSDQRGYQITIRDTSVLMAITAKQLSIGGLKGVDKTYDATSTATLEGTAVLKGALITETVGLDGTPIANFADPAVGQNKAITVTGYRLSGDKSILANYTLVQPQGLHANILAPASALLSRSGPRPESTDRGARYDLQGRLQ